MADGPPPPKHLTRSAKRWWREVVAEFDLEPHHLRILQLAGEAWDRSQEARVALADHGSLIVVDRFGQLKAHPAVAIERDSRVGFARLVRELALYDAAEPDIRPPRLAEASTRLADKAAR